MDKKSEPKATQKRGQADAKEPDELDAAAVMRSSYNSGPVANTRYGGSYEYDRKG